MENIKLNINGTDYEMICDEEYNPNYAVPILYKEGVRYLGRIIKKEKDIPKDWEIIEYKGHNDAQCSLFKKGPNGLFYDFPFSCNYRTEESLIQNKYTIHSVKRLR